MAAKVPAIQVIPRSRYATVDLDSPGGNWLLSQEQIEQIMEVLVDHSVPTSKGLWYSFGPSTCVSHRVKLEDAESVAEAVYDIARPPADA